VDEHRVSSWRELFDALFDVAWDVEIGRVRSPFAYRGCSDASADMTTSLSRLGEHAFEVERPLLRNFQKYAAEAGRPPDVSTWRTLALAQHYGLPTRLLDWTYSPLVAAHFATHRPELDADAAIWSVDFTVVHRHLPEALRLALEEERSDVVTVEMLEAAYGNLREFDDAAQEPFVAFMEPPSFDERIVRQWALFSVMSSPTAALDDWLGRTGVPATRIVIPADLRWEVRDRLDQAGINERLLFPGLDGLAQWLSRYYAPRGAGPGRVA
jgi:hypothetical protein